VFAEVAFAQDGSWEVRKSSIKIRQSAPLPPATPGGKVPPLSSCNPRNTTVLYFELVRGEDVLWFSQSEACNRPVIGTSLFKYRAYSIESYHTYAIGGFTRDGTSYKLLDGEIIVELTSGNRPSNYHVTFDMRFAEEEDHARYLDGEILENDRVIRLSGMVTLEPIVVCRAWALKYEYQNTGPMHSRGAPPVRNGNFCYKLLGLPDPMTGVPAGSPRRRTDYKR